MGVATKFCPSCQVSYPELNNFCERCQRLLIGSSATQGFDEPDDLRPTTPPDIATEPEPPSALSAFKSKQVVVGVAAVLILIGLGVLLFSVHEANQFNVRVLFRDASGLKVGDAVLLRGTDIGEVTDIRLEESQRVIVS